MDSSENKPPEDSILFIVGNMKMGEGSRNWEGRIARCDARKILVGIQ